jgi:hypothetical protein
MRCLQKNSVICLFILPNVVCGDRALGITLEARGVAGLVLLGGRNEPRSILYSVEQETDKVQVGKYHLRPFHARYILHLHTS